MDKPTIAERLVSQMRAAMFRPEREYLGGFLVFWAVIVLCAAAPAAVAVLSNGALLGASQDSAQAICAVPNACTGDATAGAEDRTVESVTSTIYRAKVAFLGALALLWVLGGGVLWAQFRIARRYWDASLSDRVSGAEYSLLGPGFMARLVIQIVVFAAVLACLAQVGVLKHPSGDGLWLWAVLTLLAAGAVLVVAQTAPPDPGPVKRTDLRRDLRHAPLLVLPATAAVGLALGYGATLALGLDQEMWAALVDDSPVWSLVVAATIALIFSVIVVTGLATYSYARDYPAQWKTRAILNDVVDYPPRAAEIADELWEMLETHVATAIREDKPDAMSPKQAQEAFQPMPCMTRMPAASCDALIRLMAMPMAVVIVTGLVVLSLGLAALSGAQTPGAGESPLVADGLLIWLGIALTLTFGLVFIPPLVRLGTFKASDGGEKPEKTKAWYLRLSQPPVESAPLASGGSPDGVVPLPRHWTVAEVSVVSDATLQKERKAEIARKEKTLDPNATETIELHKRPDVETLGKRVLRLHLGADEAKFTAILHSQRFGGVFQELMGETTRSKLISLLTLLAPTLTSTLIELIK